MPKRRKPISKYHHGDLRAALLVEALKFIERSGLEGLSLRELARNLGVSTAAPYHHFADRTELLRALALHGFELLEAQMREGLDQAGESPVVRIQALGREYLRFASRHPSHFRLMFRRDWVAEPSNYAEPGETGFAMLRRTVVDCLDRAGRGKEDPTPTIFAMWGGVHGMAGLLLDGPLGVLGPVEVDSLCEQALASLVHALSKKSRSA